MSPRKLWRRVLCFLDWHDWFEVQFFYHGWEECGFCGNQEVHY